MGDETTLEHQREMWYVNTLNLTEERESIEEKSNIYTKAWSKNLRSEGLELEHALCYGDLSVCGGFVVSKKLKD